MQIHLLYFYSHYKMTFPQFTHQLITGIQGTSALEYIGTFTGIASVWYSRKENILVYPVGLVSTVIYIYISIKGNLFGEASVNIYYTIMSFYGWYLWAKKDTTNHQNVLHISSSTKKEWIQQLLFFAVCYVVIFVCLVWLKNTFLKDTIPWADAFASATAYTAMWLMAKKKLENWVWWIVTNAASMPLYFIKGYAFTSIQFLVFFAMAVAGFIEWKRKIKYAAT